ncbi:hypothetical protein GH714_037944 [Hevea brasiliensis]|uniref:NAC domain-containing protein n=1 Tax=Hevea brasiliensis TaxID=3981 RepID=A0A6A6L9A4_HEVBR|nr:hypothetical protein GH714_037944 [Hevea brasiliensis]
MGRETSATPQTPAPAAAVAPAGKMKTTALAPGFRFHPTDEELVSYYLKRKVSNKPVRFNAIAEVDIYKNEPWDLADKSRLKSRDQEWYFFSALDRKYGNGARMNRATGKGYWKATGKDRAVRRDSQLIAMKKTLVFHSGRAPGASAPIGLCMSTGLLMKNWKKMEPCRVFHKNNIGPPNGNRYAPFIEEEWDDGETVLVPGEDAVDEVPAHDACAEINCVEPDTHSINRDPLNMNELPKDSENVNEFQRDDLPLCKTERVDDCPPCVLNTEASLSLLQYKRRKHNGDTILNHSKASENSTRTTQDLSSSTTSTAATTTIATTDTMMTTATATTTAISALLEFSLMESIEPKENPRVPHPRLDTSNLGSSVPPSCMKFINDLQSEIHKISIEKETMKLEMMSAQAMINILQSRIDFLNKENEDLKRSIRDA